MSKNRKIGSQTKFSSSLDFHFSQHIILCIFQLSNIMDYMKKKKKNLSINMKIFNQKQI